MIHDLTHVLTDPAHWVAEGVMDLVFTFAVAYPLAKWRVRVHDRKVHGKGVQTPRTVVE